MKRCPFCAEEIQDAAIKCRYCGSMLEEPAAVTALGDQFEDVRAVLRGGNKINAIKLLREKTNWGLKESKDFVEDPNFAAGGLPGGFPVGANPRMPFPSAMPPTAASSKTPPPPAGCGSVIVVFLLFGGLIWGGYRACGPGGPSEPTKATATTSASPARSAPEALTSMASYEDLNSDVGCGSKYSDERKDDLFKSRYRGRRMTWRGEVVLADSGSASLDIDGKGTQDLAVDFADRRAGYNLIRGQMIAVEFVMKSAGGCILPFGGSDAVIVK